MKLTKRVKFALIAFMLSFTAMGQGCFLSATSANSMGNIMVSSGNPQLDNALFIENNALKIFFGVNCSFYFYNDFNGKNAYFTSNVYNNAMPDGTIIFGINLLNEQLMTFNRFGAGGGIPFILAHEVAHAKANQMGWNFSSNGTIKKNELFADYCAGIFMHYRQYMISTDIQNALSTFFQIGEYEFNNPSHHGTPQERYNAILAGFNFMQYFKTNFPYQQFTDQTLYQSAKNYLDTYVSDF